LQCNKNKKDIKRVDIYNWIEKCKKEFQMCDGPLNNVIREELFNVDIIWSLSL